MDAFSKARIVYDAMKQPLKLDFNNPKSAAVAGKELQMSIRKMIKKE